MPAATSRSRSRYITDEIVQLPGLFVDDIVVSTGQGSTGFEGGTLAPWTTPGAPAGSPGNPTDWIVGDATDVGNAARATGSRRRSARQPEIIRFMAGVFGPYPFATSGGIIDDAAEIGFALETQTRPVYSRWFFGGPEGNDFVFVHELAHQWYGDSLAVARWQDIWLNEGFATYAEWLWSEEEGFGTAQEIFDFWADEAIPPDDPFWALTIGDPGPDRLFDFAVYVRGAMTLHALRLEIGDADFFDLLETWATSRAGGNVTTPEFIALAERHLRAGPRWAVRHLALHRGLPGVPGVSDGSCGGGRLGHRGRSGGFTEPLPAIRQARRGPHRAVAGTTRCGAGPVETRALRMSGSRESRGSRGAHARR